MPRKKTVAKSKKPEVSVQKLYWLGPLVLFISMLSASLLTSMLTPAFGTEAAFVGFYENEVFENDDNLKFVFVSVVGIVQPENGNVVVTLRFTNLSSENVLSKSYKLSMTNQLENESIDIFLQPGENSEQSFTIEVNENREFGVYQFTLSDNELDPDDDGALVGTGFLRWSAPIAISNVTSQLVTYAIALSVAYLHVTKFEGRKFWSSVGIRRENMLWSVVWVFALYVVFTLALQAYWAVIGPLFQTGSEQVSSSLFAGAPEWFFVYLGIAFFIPVAFTEELIFRGFMIEHFWHRGALKAVIISGLFFAFLHIGYLSYGLVSIPIYGALFMIAFWWGLAYYKTRNIFGLIIAHGLFNISNAGMTVQHFWGADGMSILNSAIFLVGVVCIMYLVYLYLRGLFTEMEELVRK